MGPRGKRLDHTLAVWQGNPLHKNVKFHVLIVGRTIMGFVFIALLSTSFFMLQCLNSISQILGQPWQLLVVLESEGHIVTEHN
jgi:hypothetical protein